ncbi:hypothetical protein [Campylobacter sp. M4]
MATHLMMGGVSIFDCHEQEFCHHIVSYGMGSFIVSQVSQK